jgi:hypothetical protein
VTLSDLLALLVGLDVEEGLGNEPIGVEQQPDGTFWLVIGQD